MTHATGSRAANARESIIRLIAYTITATPSNYTDAQLAERIVERLEANRVAFLLVEAAP